MPTPFRALRVRKHSEYGLVYGASRKHQSVSLSYFYRDRSDPVGDGVSPRFGITAPRVLGPAVLRNRIKRRLRVAARAALPLLPAGTDVLLHPRPTVAAMPFSALQNEIRTVFETVARRLATGAINTPLPRVPRRGASSARAGIPKAGSKAGKG